ncbi:cysteine--tRNA ligase [soil metagenome]
MKNMQEQQRFPIRIYNSLSRKKELFKPIKSPHVGLYVCGPTVYGDPHLGHARAGITFDVIYRYFLHMGFKVRYVRNITDVGHLENEESDSGEDKIAKKARLEELEPMEVVQYYTIQYHKGLDALNCKRPNIEPTASGHIVDQIKLIEKIIANGLAYEVNGNVYFDLETYGKTNSYGELSGKVLEDLRAGSRDTEGLEEKKSPHDFALWKKAAPEHIMRWDSPWGVGFPGWHIECTTMSTKYLGERFDIHGGGLDLQFPHHEAEIAQCRGANGTDPANYWIHNNMVTIDGAKMSKSVGNFITLDQLFAGDHDFLNREFSPMSVRFLILQSHYRSKIDFSNEALEAAEKGYQKLMNSLRLLEEIHLDNPEKGRLDDEINTLCDRCYEKMSDDFNTAQVLAVLFEIVNKINAIHHKQIDENAISSTAFEKMKRTFTVFITDILGLKTEESSDNEKTEDLIQLLIQIRAEARVNKDFATSDKIRDELKEMGIILKDEKSGKTTYEIESS